MLMYSSYPTCDECCCWRGSWSVFLPIIISAVAAEDVAAGIQPVMNAVAYKLLIYFPSCDERCCCWGCCCWYATFDECCCWWGCWSVFLPAMSAVAAEDVVAGILPVMNALADENDDLFSFQWWALVLLLLVSYLWWVLFLVRMQMLVEDADAVILPMVNAVAGEDADSPG